MVYGKKRLYIGLIVLMAVFLLLLCHWAAGTNEEKAPTLPVTVKVRHAGEVDELLPWCSEDGKWYFFLPSYALPEQTFLCPKEKNCRFQQERLTSERSLADVETEKEYLFEYCDAASEQTAAVVFLQSANVPAMFLRTSSGSMETIYADKSHKEITAVWLYGADGRTAYKSTGKDRLKGRGNTTWVQPKKPFRLMLSRDAGLLGMAASSEWILLANSYDETNLRDKLIYDFAEKAEMGWTPHGEFVELYLNGEYNGLYLLSEKIEVAENRLALSESDGDYLLESILSIRIEENAQAVDVGDKLHFVVDFPENCGEAGMEKIRQDVLLLDESICTGDLSRIDLDSWAKRYLIDEIFINHDAGYLSAFYHFDSASGKFFAGPIWDYDLSFGSGNAPQQQPDQIWAVNVDWYRELYRNEVFYDRLRTVYRETFLPELERMLREELPQQTEKLAAAARSNRVRWESMFAGSLTTEEKLAVLPTFLRERIAYLNNAWLSDREYDTVRWYAADRTTLLASEQVRHGETVSACPAVDGETVSVWCSPEDGRLFDPAQPVYTDLRLIPAPDQAQQPAEGQLVEEQPAEEQNGASAQQSAATGVVQWLRENPFFVLFAALCAAFFCFGAVMLYVDARRSGMIPKKEWK